MAHRSGLTAPAHAIALSPPFERWTGGGPEALSAALFAGRLLALDGLASVARFGAAARRIVEEHFGADPETAESRLDPEAMRAAVAAARRAAAADVEIAAAWNETLSAIGYDPSDLHFDRMRLRIAPSRGAAQSRFVQPLPAHRDSWGGGVAAQVNWWAPLYPLDPARTMVLWPDLFAVAVPNTAAEWDYARARKGGDYPLLPVAREIPAGRPISVTLPPGALLAFSAAHLHASVTDRSGRTRFSLDTRTVWACDVDAGRGAPDVDGAGTPPRWGMFDRLAKNRPTA